MKGKIINIIAKLDNGSHSSDQLKGVDEALFELFHDHVEKIWEQVNNILKDTSYKDKIHNVGFAEGWRICREATIMNVLKIIESNETPNI